MNRLLMAGGVALTLAAGSAFAQTSTTTTTTGPASVSSTTITTDQQAKVKAYITKEKIKSVAVPSGFTVQTGAMLPAAIEVRTFPADLGVKQYSYAVVGERTVLVEPGSRRIVQVIQ
jgi:hypothetical protein